MAHSGDNGPYGAVFWISVVVLPPFAGESRIEPRWRHVGVGPALDAVLASVQSAFPMQRATGERVAASRVDGVKFYGPLARVVAVVIEANQRFVHHSVGRLLVHGANQNSPT